MPQLPRPFLSTAVASNPGLSGQRIAETEARALAFDTGNHMNKEDELKALLDRAKELKEIGEKLMKESDELMEEYEAQKLRKRRRARAMRKALPSPEG